MIDRLAAMWWRLVRFGFRLLYNEMAFTYDLVSEVVSLGSWRCWQKATLKHIPPAAKAGKILEIAHGTGNLQLDLNQAGYTTMGYDLSPYMGRIAQSKLKRAQHEAHLTRGMAQQLPFADEAFAVVISTFPTNFIVQSSTLSEVYRILEPRGRFIIVLNGEFTGQGILRDFLEWLYRITGQRDDDSNPSAEAVFGGHGFSVSTLVEPCSQSQAQVVILQK